MATETLHPSQLSSCEQEQAEALGFASVEQMRDHGHWLAQQQAHREAVSARVAAADDGQVIDLRGLEA